MLTLLMSLNRRWRVGALALVAILALVLAVLVTVTADAQIRLRSSGSGGGDRALLTEADFTYSGYYEMGTGDNANYAQGFTARTVSGTLRFAIGVGLISSSMYLREFTLPASFGQNVTWRTWMNTDPYLLGAGSPHIGLWFNENVSGSDDELWVDHACDYPQAGCDQDAITVLRTWTVSDADVLSNLQGYWGYNTVGMRATYGGVMKVPTWFKNTYSTQEYLTGWGGYTSLCSGRTPSLGPFFLFFPRPHGVYTELSWDVTTGGIPTTDYTIAADHRGSHCNGADWYSGSYASRTVERGIRATLTHANYFDSGDPRSNPDQITRNVDVSGTTVTYDDVPGAAFDFSNKGWWAGYSGTVGGMTENGTAYQVNINATPYTVASVDSATQLTLTASAGTISNATLVGPLGSLAPKIGVLDSGLWDTSEPTAAGAPSDPDGWARWNSHDTYNNTCQWIDNDAGTRTKHGFVCIASLQNGKTWYCGSSGCSESKEYEIHVFNPTTIAQGYAGSISAWKVRPTYAWSIKSLLAGITDNGGDQSGERIIGAKFVNNKLYVFWGQGGGGGGARLFEFAVAGS